MSATPTSPQPGKPMPRAQALPTNQVAPAQPAQPPASRHSRAFNFGVGDVSKTHVAHVMEEAFGYPLALDPTTHVGRLIPCSADLFPVRLCP